MVRITVDLDLPASQKAFDIVRAIEALLDIATSVSSIVQTEYIQSKGLIDPITEE